MTPEERLEDLITWGNRLDPNESKALLNKDKVIKTLHIDGTQFLRIELSIIDISVRSQIIGGKE